MKAHYFSFCNSATENRTHLCYHFGNSETWLGKYWYIQPPFHRIPPSWQDWFLRYVVYEALAVWIRVSKTVTGTLPFKVEMLLILCPLVYKNNTIWTCLAVYVIRSPTWCKPKKKKNTMCKPHLEFHCLMFDLQRFQEQHLWYADSPTSSHCHSFSM